MLDIFSSIPIRARDITGNLIHAQIQIHENDLFSGIFHINGNGQSAFLFAQGKLISIYKLSDKRWLKVPGAEWEELISGSSGELRVASLAIEGVRVFRLFFESDFSEAKTVPSLPASELSSYVNHWQRGDKAGIVLIHQNDASALMLFPARETTSTESVLVSDLQPQTGFLVVNQIKAWGNRLCQVTACTYDERSEAWNEYFLRTSFSQFVQNVLRRYGEIAGQFLVSDLNEQANDEMKNWGMALLLNGNSLSNRQFFETLDRAGQAYVTMLNTMNEQMKVVVGAKVVMNIRQEAIMQLVPDKRVFVQEYVISRLSQDMQERV